MPGNGAVGTRVTRPTTGTNAAAYAAVFGLCVVLFVSVVPFAPILSAHDIPNDVTVQSFVRPDGQTLSVLLRVPLAAMRDMDYPKRGTTSSGLLDLSRADA